MRFERFPSRVANFLSLETFHRWGICKLNKCHPIRSRRASPALNLTTSSSASARKSREQPTNYITWIYFNEKIVSIFSFNKLLFRSDVGAASNEERKQKIFPCYSPHDHLPDGKSSLLWAHGEKFSLSKLKVHSLLHKGASISYSSQGALLESFKNIQDEAKQ